MINSYPQRGFPQSNDALIFLVTRSIFRRTCIAILATFFEYLCIRLCALVIASLAVFVCVVIGSSSSRLQRDSVQSTSRRCRR